MTTERDGSGTMLRAVELLREVGCDDFVNPPTADAMQRAADSLEALANGPLPSQAFIDGARAVLSDEGETARVVHLIASELDPDAFTGKGYGMGAGQQAREQALQQAAQILQRIARSHA